MTVASRIKVGSRTSPLSLVQNEEALAPVRQAYPSVEFEIVPLTTRGDRRKDAPLLSMSRGMFVKDIEAALLRREIDLAVHSAKDMLATVPDGLTIGAFVRRRDPRDVLVNRWGLAFRDLPSGARIGTSSPRRAGQLGALRPDVDLLPIRGNVGTRLDKARGDDYDGVVLAAAGLIRLGREDEVAEYLTPEQCIPEVGQGALAVEARADDDELLAMLCTVDDERTRTEVESERAFLRTVGGGCKVPVAAYSRLEGDLLLISAMASLPDGSRSFRVEVSANPADPEAAGRAAAEALIEAGAGEIIARDGAP